MNQEEYNKKFKIPKSVENGDGVPVYEKALKYALDIRKFEIELYWKRATYFWTFIAASFAGYAIVYKTSVDNNSWLLLVFSCLGLLFSVAWYLVNRGSKFWQNNWERHVDLLEDHVIGPLYKTIATNPTHNTNILTSAAQYSVSKINQILSAFISLFWVLLIFKSFLPISLELQINYFKIGVVLLTIIAIICLSKLTTSSNKSTETKLEERKLSVKS